MIRLITIKNFRSIANQTFKVEEITTFVGRNDAGKSNILRALNLFFNGQTDHNHYFNFTNDYNKYAPKYSQRAQEIFIEIALKLPKSYRSNIELDHVYWKKVWRKEGVRSDYEESGLCTIKHDKIHKRSKGFPPRSKIQSLINAIDFEYIPATKDSQYFQNLQIKLYDSLANFSDQGLHNSASSFEKEINTHVEGLTKAIDKEFSGSNIVKLPKNLRSIFGALEFNSNQIPLSSRGDGIKIRHIPMILSFIADRKQQAAKRNTIKPQIWAFEEPENNVEFLSCFKLNCQLIEAATNYTQILITTHSPAIYSIGYSDTLPNHVKSTSYYVNQDNNSTFVNQTDESTLHGNMGFLQLIAPMIQSKKAEWGEKESGYIKNQTALKRQLESSKKPQLFLEGVSDHIVFKRLLEARGLDNEINIVAPLGDGNSANSATDRAHAFHLIQKHVAGKNKLKAVVILDNDKSGNQASQKLKDIIDPKYIKILNLKPSSDLQKILSLKGLKVAVDLEHLMPESIWRHAKEMGWAIPVEDNYEKLNENGRKMICNGSAEFHTLIGELTDHQKDLINYEFTQSGKRKLSNYIKNLPDGDKINDLLYSFQTPLDLIEKHLIGTNEQTTPPAHKPNPTTTPTENYNHRANP